MAQLGALTEVTVGPPDGANVAARMAQSDLPVLLTGEIGCGKRYLARWIHERSRRASHPLIQISCATLAPEQLGAELFGAVRRAADSSAARTSPLLGAHGGTLVMAAVDALPDEAQRRLLRLLCEGCIDVGPNEPARAVDLRVIATTTADLAALVSCGSFRTDLYFRLRVLHMEVPPLRERAGQIEQLVRHFVCRAAGGRDPHIPSDLLDAMSRRSWPGNVRELESACEQLVLSCPNGELRLADLPDELSLNLVHGSEVDRLLPHLPATGIGLFELERRLITRVLEREKGNVTRAAAYLKIPRHILAYRMGKYGIRRV